VSGLIQRLVAHLWVTHDASAARAAYRARREAMLAALAARGIEAIGPSGLNVWIPVPDEDAAVRALLARGVSIAAGRPFRLASGPAVRITTATVLPDEAAMLAAALDPPRRTRAA
jgi:DNA-binding transcriptional MocR family regulator